MGPRTSQTWKSQSSETLVTVVAKVMLPAPRGTCWGAAVGQSFLLEMCVRCLTWSRHRWYSSDRGMEAAAPALPETRLSSDLSWEAPSSVFPLPVCPSLCNMYTFHVAYWAVCMKLPLTRQWPPRRHGFGWLFALEPQHSAWHIVTLNHNGSWLNIWIREWVRLKIKPMWNDLVRVHFVERVHFGSYWACVKEAEQKKINFRIHFWDFVNSEPWSLAAQDEASTESQQGTHIFPKTTGIQRGKWGFQITFIYY